MAIDIERLKLALDTVIRKFGNWNHEIGELKQSQPVYLWDLIIMRNELSEALDDESKPAEEWSGEGLPPVGCECEAVWLDLPDGGDRDFTRILIKGYYDYGGGFKRVWFGVMPDDEDICRSAGQCDFRPIKTPEQRQRDELAILIITANEMCDIKQMEDREDREGFIAKCIMNRYNLEPK